ncbi:DMT family transporter [Microbacterium sp. ZW T5_45]|uniref:DMT family transporter n=1 Tax=Microbacterium sp. ZW T5_45 TaxID=3378080 RepID=UPI00385244B7
MRTPTPLLLAATAVLYALNYPLGALALQSMSAFLMITLRFLVTAVVMWLVVLLVRPSLPQGRAWWHAVGAGLLVQGAQFLGAYWAMSHGVGAGVTALIVAMNPVVVTLLTSILERRRDSWRSYGPVVLGAIAVILACVPRIARDPSLGAAALAVVLALLGLAIGSVWQARALSDVSPVSFTAIGVTASFPLAAVFALSVPRRVDPGAHTWALFVIVALVGLVGTTLYATSVRVVGPRRASMMFAVIPALAAVGSWVLLDEPLDAGILIALVLGCAACLWDLRRARTGSPQVSVATVERESVSSDVRL